MRGSKRYSMADRARSCPSNYKCVLGRSIVFERRLLVSWAFRELIPVHHIRVRLRWPGGCADAARPDRVSRFGCSRTVPPLIGLVQSPWKRHRALAEKYSEMMPTASTVRPRWGIGGGGLGGDCSVPSI